MQCMLPVVDMLNHDAALKPVHLSVVLTPLPPPLPPTETEENGARAAAAAAAATTLGPRCVRVVAGRDYADGQEVRRSPVRSAAPLGAQVLDCASSVCEFVRVCTCGVFGGGVWGGVVLVPMRLGLPDGGLLGAAGGVPR